MVELNFSVYEAGSHYKRQAGRFTLVRDNWDDHGYKTTYNLLFEDKYRTVNVGSVKIARRGMKYVGLGSSENDSKTSLPETFTALAVDYYSLGQDVEYYEHLKELPDGVGERVLAALRDVSAFPDIFESVREEEAFTTSLLRFVPENTVTGQFRRIARGGDKLVSYGFKYSKPQLGPSGEPLELTFSVNPNSMPPENVHAIIGPNGAGKSTLLKDFFLAAIEDDRSDGKFFIQGAADSMISDFPFVNVLHISFSAFDDELDLSIFPERNGIVGYQTVGLSTYKESLEEQFAASLDNCTSDSRLQRWSSLLENLAHSEPLLNELLVDFDSEDAILAAKDAFKGLSSGHKIVTLTITRLVELVKEKTLILIDEPETHLHPPLLSALTRTISDMAAARNGIVILATHSPVVLQEIPSSCIWKVQRSSGISRAHRILIESFGESVSTLTSEVFRLSIDNTGFRKILADLLRENGNSVQLTLDALGNRLGIEGRYLLSSLALQMDTDHV